MTDLSKGAIVAGIILIISIILGILTVRCDKVYVREQMFPPTSTNILSIDKDWYSFILNDEVWYVRDFEGSPVYIKAGEGE